MLIENLAHHRSSIPIIARWHFEQWGPLTGFATLAEYVAFLESSTRSEELPTVLVAFLEGEGVGSGSLLACDMTIRPQLTPWLAQLFVLPSYRGHGIGTALVQAVAGEAHRRGYSRLYLYTSGELPRYYGHLGWTICERVQYLGKERMVMQIDLPMAVDTGHAY